MPVEGLKRNQPSFSAILKTICLQESTPPLTGFERSATGRLRPKSEDRNPKEGRRPKSEMDAVGLLFGLRISAFFRASGIRPSDFGMRSPFLQHALVSR